MNIVIAVVLFVTALSFMNERVAQAVGAFLVAGVVPGTSLQLPWYVTLLAIPLLIVGIVRLTSNATSESLPAPAPVKAPTRHRKRKPTITNRATAQSAKKKKATKLPARRFTQLEA